MNTKLRNKAKNNFKKDFSKLINNAIEKTMENVRKRRSIELLTTEVSEQSYYTKKFFMEDLLVIEMRKAQMLMNKTFYLRLSILDLSKTGMYKFWYDYIKPKYVKYAKLCYMDIDTSLFM